MQSFALQGFLEAASLPPIPVLELSLLCMLGVASVFLTSLWELHKGQGRQMGVSWDQVIPWWGGGLQGHFDPIATVLFTP